MRLAAILIFVTVVAPATMADGPIPHRSSPTEAPVLDEPAGRYRVQIEAGIYGPAREAIRIIEHGMGTSLGDPRADRVLIIGSMGGGYAMGSTAQAMGVSMRDSLNGYVHTCRAKAVDTLSHDTQVEVLLHELLHCIGIGHADSGIMGGGYEAGQRPSSAEFAAARCVLTGDRCGVLDRDEGARLTLVFG